MLIEKILSRDWLEETLALDFLKKEESGTKSGRLIPIPEPSSPSM